MQYTVDEIYNLLCKKVNGIREIFENFFGESHVDMQGCDLIKLRLKNILNVPDNYEELTFPQEELDRAMKHFVNSRITIYVWWPEVTVTNENDRSTKIQDLYARIVVQMDGRIPYENHGFLLNRATYTSQQFQRNYMHSHISNIPKDNFTMFQPPCLGTGPIRNTIASLKNESDDALWMLFCEELSMYVTVESLTGRPYHKLEDITADDTRRLTEYYDYYPTNSPNFIGVLNKEKVMEFIKYYLSNGHLSVSYRQGEYQPSLPYYDYIIDVSNCFIDFYNEKLSSITRNLERMYNMGLLNEVYISNRMFLTKGNRSLSPNSMVRMYEGKSVLTFKGKEIKVHIIIDNTDEVPASTVVSQNFAMYVLYSILRTINYRYKNGKNRIKNREEGTAPTQERIIYL